MSKIEAVISDFGGVLTTPLLHAFTAMQEEDGLPPRALGSAMGAITERDGAHPLFELECGRMTEVAFLDLLAAELRAQLGREVVMHRFAERYFALLEPNEPLIEAMRALRAHGLRMGMLTNNVREWEPLWRAFLPVDEIFEDVVDSAFVGLRKPDPAIYELALSRLGVAASATVFVDDMAVNCEAATALGMKAIHHVETAETVAALAALTGAVLLPLG